MAAEAWRMLHHYRGNNLAARYSADIDAERRSKGNSLRLDSSDGFGGPSVVHTSSGARANALGQDEKVSLPQHWQWPRATTS
jgi:hypothetical protein